jgi:hypothetical protein
MDRDATLYAICPGTTAPEDVQSLLDHIKQSGMGEGTPCADTDDE